ncbi:MAG: hypothetical protein Q4F05_11075 [bacterium]|nr:hypothetical protein [bacterium]
MKIQAKNMRKSIHRVSLLLAFKRARVITICLLLLDLVQRVYYRYPITGIYIVLLYILLPFVLGILLRPYINQELEQELPIMQKIYKYTKNEYYSLTITTVIVSLMSVLWGSGTSQTKNISEQSWHMRMGPLLICGVCISVIIGVYYYNRKELVKRLKNNAL